MAIRRLTAFNDARIDPLVHAAIEAAETMTGRADITARSLGGHPLVGRARRIRRGISRLIRYLT